MRAILNMTFWVLNDRMLAVDDHCLVFYIEKSYNNQLLRKLRRIENTGDPYTQNDDSACLSRNNKVLVFT